jgi:hypothetical protein
MTEQNTAIAYRGVDGAATATGTTPAQIRDAVRLGFLNPKRVGLATIFLRSELEAWLQSRPAPHNRRPKREKTDAESSN